MVHGVDINMFKFLSHRPQTCLLYSKEWSSQNTVLELQLLNMKVLNILTDLSFLLLNLLREKGLETVKCKGLTTVFTVLTCHSVNSPLLVIVPVGRDAPMFMGICAQPVGDIACTLSDPKKGKNTWKLVRKGKSSWRQ